MADRADSSLDLGHCDLELLAVLCRLDGLGVCTDQLAPKPLEHAGLLQLHRQVETGLATEGRQHGIGSFFFDDLLEDLQIKRLDIGGVGETRIGHDRRRVRVREDDSIALFLQDPAGLGAGVVELTGLTDHDRAGADDEDRFDIGALRHLRPPFLEAVHELGELGEQIGRVVRAGPASGWYCTLKAGYSLWTRPERVPSLRHTWLSVTFGTEPASTAKLWFWAVISTFDVRVSCTGTLPPWWPNFIL